ncbi:hypothetical protein Tco_1358774, partial [Tanacetum coccineum]
ETGLQVASATDNLQLLTILALPNTSFAEPPDEIFQFQHQGPQGQELKNKRTNSLAVAPCGLLTYQFQIALASTATWV